MAKKDQEINTQDLVDIDAICDAVSKDLKLPPTNLARGELVSDAVSTGTLAIDLILGGGFAPGRRSNVFGREQAGKTTLLYHAVKACLDRGIYVIFYDFEGSTDGDRVERIGVRHDWTAELKAKQPVLFRYFDKMQHGEQMFQHAHRILQKLPDREEGPVQIVFCLDSLPTVLPQQKAENDETHANSLRARLFSDNLPLIKTLLSSKRCAWLDVNQLRDRPQVRYGSPEYEPCGEAVRTGSDCRLKVKKTIPTGGRGRPENKRYIEEEPSWDGPGVDRYNFANYYVVKNKSFAPFRDATTRMWFEESGQPGRGIDPVYDVYEYLRLTGQVQYRNRPQREFVISLPPFDQEREVLVDEVDKNGEPKVDKDGVVKQKAVKRDAWTWRELKGLVLRPDLHDNIPDITATCRQQIDNHSAFELYFSTRLLESKAMMDRQAKKDGT